MYTNIRFVEKKSHKPWEPAKEPRLLAAWEKE